MRARVGWTEALRRVLIAATGLLIAVALTAPPTVLAQADELASTPATPAERTGQEVLFNDPWGGTKAQRRIADRYIQLIGQAQKGSDIRISLFSLSDVKLTDAMIKAKKRGVRIQVILDRHAWNTKQVKRLRKALGTSTKRAAWVIKRKGTVTHSKFLAIATGHIAVISSQNGTKSGIWQQANDAIITYGDTALYDALVTQHRLMASGTLSRAALATTTTSGATTLRFYPQSRQRADPVAQLLDNVTCRVGNGRTKIWGVMWMWFNSRLHIAERLVELEEAGCDVRLVVSPDETKKKVRKTLLKGQVATRTPTGKRWPHSKYFVIDGFDADGNRLRVVQAGSPNLLQDAYTTHDEVAIVSTSPAVVLAYEKSHKWLWTKHTRKLKQ